MDVWKTSMKCVKLQVVLTLMEEFIDLGCLYVFKLYFVCHLFQSFLGFFPYDQKPNKIQSIPHGIVLCSPAGSVYFGGGGF